MNKLRIILLQISITFLFFSCSSNKETIELIQTKSNYPIVLYLNKEHKEIVGIKIPLKVEIKNNSVSKKKFSSLDYKYAPYTKGIGNLLYFEKNNKLIRVKQSKKKNIGYFQNKRYIIYTRHRIDTSKVTQAHFTSYVDKMIKNKQDTLAIGTVMDFKKNHVNLLRDLTKNDSLSLDIWKAKNVIIPVKW